MKIVEIQTVFPNGELVYRPVNREFQTNNWYIKVLHVGFECLQNNEINEVLKVSCNFVTSEKYLANIVKTYEQPLQMCYVKASPNGKSAHRFSDKLWHKINRPSSQLRFSVLNLDGRPLETQMKFSIIFAIQQI